MKNLHSKISIKYNKKIKQQFPFFQTWSRWNPAQL